MTKKEAKELGKNILNAECFYIKYVDEVNIEVFKFLCYILKYNDEWKDKFATGVKHIIVLPSEHTYHTRCFTVMFGDGTKGEVSFNWAVKCMPREDLKPWCLTYGTGVEELCVDGVKFWRYDDMSTWGYKEPLDLKTGRDIRTPNGNFLIVLAKVSDCYIPPKRQSKK